MKNILIPINILSLLVIALLLMSQKENTAETTIKYQDCNKVCIDYSGTNYPLLNGKLLKEMASNYQSPNNRNSNFSVMNLAGKQKVQKSNNIIVDDANSVWFPLADLKRFLWEIETRVCKNSCSILKPSDLGVRIYYARYPETSKYYQLSNGLSLQNNYEWLHTAFMVPTYEDRSLNQHVDFLLDSPFSEKTCLPTKVPSGDNTNFNISALLPDGKNHGDLCPPLCKGGNAF
jgi:hypothetical protein